VLPYPAMVTARFIALRVLLLVAMAYSSMLAIDVFTAGDATFCTGERAGCEAVKLSALSEPLGIPLPYIGLAVFTYLMCLTFLGPRVAPLFRLSLLASGAGAAGLLAYQALVLESFCELCVVVDGSIILAAAVGLPRNLVFPAPAAALPTGAWLALSALVIAAPGLYQRLPEPRPVPDFVRALRAEKGLTIVEVADFGCKHCRTLQTTMSEALEGRQDVTLRRVIVPITGHRLGQSASTIYRCAERYGVADELALLLADGELFKEGVERWIAELPETEGSLRECMVEKSIRDSVASDRRKVREASIEGIPMTYVGDTVLRGAVSSDRIERAIRFETLGVRFTRPSPTTYGLLAFAFAALILAPAIVLARRRVRGRD
jgi:uncharacterized membrane protein/protein-disulfide isomerase